MAGETAVVEADRSLESSQFELEAVVEESFHLTGPDFDLMDALVAIDSDSLMCSLTNVAVVVEADGVDVDYCSQAEDYRTSGFHSAQAQIVPISACSHLPQPAVVAAVAESESHSEKALGWTACLN